jgi:hypothetical protein
MEKWKSKIRIPTFPRLIPLSLYRSKIKNERRTQPPPVTLVFRLISGLENAGGGLEVDH